MNLTHAVHITQKTAQDIALSDILKHKI